MSVTPDGRAEAEYFNLVKRSPMVQTRPEHWLLRLPVSFFSIPFGIGGLAAV